MAPRRSQAAYPLRGSAAANATLTADLAAAQTTIASQSATIASQNVTISDLQGQLAQQQATVAALSGTLATAFKDPSFAIAGATLQEQLTNLSSAISRLNNGQQQALYKNLGGKK